MEVHYATIASQKLTDGTINDDRFIADPKRGLFLVCDANGPTYGGYYAPFAIDPALDALMRAFDDSGGTARERLCCAFEAAHATMSDMNAAYERARAGRVGLEAAREAADAIRPAAWRGVDSLAHFGASITACAVSAGGIAVAQTGVCRAYTFDDEPSLVLREHSIAAAIEASGEKIEIDDALRHAPATLVGMGKLTIATAEIKRSPLVLCTDGMWMAADTISELFRAHSHEDVMGVLERAHTRTRDDATAVVVRP